MCVSFQLSSLLLTPNGTMRFNLCGGIALCVCFLISDSLQGGIIAYWPFNDGAGSTTAADPVGGHTGNLVNMTPAADWVTGHTGAAGDFALDFDGANNNAGGDRVEVPSFRGITGRGSRTISAWINSTATNDTFASYGTNSNGQKFVFRTNSNNGNPQTPRVEVNGGYQVGSTDIVGTGWRHVAMTWDNDGSPNVNDVQLYVNGVLEPNSATNDNNLNTARSQLFRIGSESFSNTRNFNGQIDDVAVWNRALSASEIADIATGTSPTAIAIQAPPPALQFDAGQDASPMNGTWENLTALSGANDFNLNNNAGGARFQAISDPKFPGITGAYTYDGTSDTANGATFESFPGNPTNDSAAFEVWLRPGDLNDQRVVFETGGGTDGTSITLNGSTLQFIAKDGGASAALSADVSAVAGDFFQAVGVIETDSGDAALYINGELVDSLSGSGVVDWAGANGGGIGSANGDVGGTGGAFGNLNTYSDFLGDIAIMQFFDEPLTADDVDFLYSQTAATAVPEPTSVAIWSLIGLGLAGFGYYRVRRKK